MVINERCITIVGCGPGSPQYVTEAARQAVARAEVLFGSRRLLELFSNTPAERILVDGHLAALVDRIAALRQTDRRIVVLVSGDPGLFSLAQSLVRRFGRDHCQIVPAVSAVQVAFARLGLNWSDAQLVSAHARTPEITANEICRSDKLAILAGTRNALRWATWAASLVASSHACVLCENLTLADERIRVVESGQIASLGAASLAIVLLIRRSLLL